MDNFENTETEIQHLIIRYLDGSASENEILILQKWLEESEQNFSLFDQFRQDWLSIGYLQRYQMDEAWEKVERHLLRRITGKRIHLWRQIMGYTAAIVFTFSIGYYSVKYYQQQHKQQIAVNENIEPGSKKAILVLSSDEKVVLDDYSDETLFEGNETVKREGNTLVYDERQNNEVKEEYNRLITPRGGEYSVILADGTKVWLNAESELKYPLHFKGKERQVYLKGEAYFAVTKRANQPFVVYSDETSVTVLGTEFNVRNYKDEEIATTLVKGVVKVTHENGDEFRLAPGQQAIVHKDGVEVKEVEAMYYTAWKDGYFIYENRSLDDILKELSRWYDFTYFYQNAALKNQTLTAKLRKFDRVEQIFEILSGTGHFGFITKGKTVTVVAK